ncbi:MAG: ribbon-helix-helix protein, CopG family [Candidatus Thorarchaeota archaeon]
MYTEPKMEKLTINLPPMDLARMDLLVEAGFYPSRTELIRAAIRTQLEVHQDFITKQMASITAPFEDEPIEESAEAQIGGLGVFSINKDVLKQAIKEGKMLNIIVVGMLRIAKDVTPELIDASVAKIRLYGILRAPAKVKVALQSLMEDKGDA